LASDVASESSQASDARDATLGALAGKQGVRPDRRGPR